MDVHILDGEFGFLTNDTQIILIINKRFYGPYKNTKENVLKIYNTLKEE